MSHKVGTTSRKELVNAQLPAATATYTVLSHDFIITTVLATIAKHGFELEKEEYRCTMGANVALGTFTFKYDGDPDMIMSYSFANSYDKTLKFRGAVGAHVITNDTTIIFEAEYMHRKQDGTVEVDCENLIESQIQNVKAYFDKLVEDRDAMKAIEINKNTYGDILGQLYINNIISTTQISAAKREYLKPSATYGVDVNNLWACYNHITVAMDNTHPSKWIRSKLAVHAYFLNKFNLVKIVEEEELPVLEFVKDAFPGVEVDDVVEIDIEDGSVTITAKCIEADDTSNIVKFVQVVDADYEEVKDETPASEPTPVEEVIQDTPATEPAVETVTIAEEEVPVIPGILEGVEKVEPTPVEEKVEVAIGGGIILPGFSNSAPDPAQKTIEQGIAEAEGDGVLKAAKPVIVGAESPEEASAVAEALKEANLGKAVVITGTPDPDKIAVAEAELQAKKEAPVDDGVCKTENSTTKQEVKAHVETDAEYAERVAKIEGEPEPEDLGFCEGCDHAPRKLKQEACKTCDGGCNHTAIIQEGSTDPKAEGNPFKEEATPAYEHADGTVRFPKSEYGGLLIGDAFENSMDGKYYVVKEYEGEELIATPLTDDEAVEPSKREPDMSAAMAPAEESVLPEKQEVQASTLGEDQAPVDPLASPEPVTEVADNDLDDTPAPVADTPTDPVEDTKPSQENDPMYKIIEAELEDVYGYTPKFTFTLVDNQYNIVLESDETITLSGTYINSLK